MSAFSPKLEILPPAQRRVWQELDRIPEIFTLYGGTALALHLDHRQSVDFDFFCLEHFDPGRLCQSVPLLENGRVVQSSPDTLTCVVDRGGSVSISFFGVPQLRRLSAPVVASDIGLGIAALIDLAATKAAVVQRRAEAKDYLDIDALITRGQIDLPTILAAGRAAHGEPFNPELTLKALCYFGDGNLGTLSKAVRDRLAARVREVDLDALPRIEVPQ